jgi:hypothetical protein
MEEKHGGAAVIHHILMLLLKVLLGGIAAVVGILLMRVVGSREVIVALLIGLVPGIVDKSPKKIICGAVFAVIGYTIGARVGTALAKNIIQEVAIGHWALVGGFIGMTAGLSRNKGQWFSFRFILWSLGAVYGFVFGLVLGLPGDIAGYLLIPVSEGIGLLYYTREINLVFAGVFINLGVGIAGILTGALDNGLWRVAQAVEKTEA